MTRDVIVLSLNEVETLGAKAARGAGLGWGVAEDLGRAARWLAARRIDWAAPLLRLFDGPWEASGLPLALALGDRLTGASPGEAWVMAACAPLWAMPLVAAAIHGRPIAVNLAVAGRVVRLGPDGGASASSPTDGPSDVAPLRLDVAILPPEAGMLAHPLMPDARRFSLAAQAHAALDALAARTYVPASAESRALGAGGAGLDGD